MSIQWDESIASQCRYGEIAGRIFDGAEVIFEHSENDYQGYANVFAQLRDGRFCHYEWSYGSCGGCDEWESQELTDDEIESEMRSGAVFFDDIATVERYLKLDGEFKDAKVPTSNSPDNGSISGMLRRLSGGLSCDSEFKAMGKAFQEWQIKL